MEAKDIITSLLQQNPLDRLGTGGSYEVKEHHYFMGFVDWNSLLRSDQLIVTSYAPFTNALTITG